MAIERIRKRDGRVEAFDAGKIARAILGAMRELGREDAAAAARYAERVEKLLESGRRAQVPTVEQVQDLVERVLAEEKAPDLAKAYILHRFRHAGLREAKSVLGVHDDLKLSLNAIRVLEKRYLRKDANGNIAETPSQMFRRVATAVAAVDAGYEGAGEERANAERFYALMSSLAFLPNSPTLMNAGTDLGQLSACFVLPVEDSMDGIFSALRNMAFIHQSGGGTGFSFSHLRPSGDVVRSTGGVASGPISFIEVFDKATDVIKQGGRRRGANMAILSVDHADAMDFILCKTRPKFLENFNISVSITDAFMQAVESGGEHAFINPRTGEATDRRPAREVFDLICSAAWQCGDPGLVFMDEVNRCNPLVEVARIEATNPCVTGDTWVQTSAGARQVRALVGKKFHAFVNGRPHATGPAGFFRTGLRRVVKLRTVEGYAARSTGDHLFRRVTRRTRDTIKSEWTLAARLNPGDEVLLHNHRARPRWPGDYTREQGYLLGLLVGDGVLKRDKAILSVWNAAGPGIRGVKEEALRCARALQHRADFKGWIEVKGRAESRLSLSALRDLALECGMSAGRKAVAPKLEQGSSRFCRGFLRGLFDADGSVQGGQVKGVSVRLAQSDLARLEAVQRMLLRLGIVSTIYDRRAAGTKLLPDGKGGRKTYHVQRQHELVISGDNLAQFGAVVGFADGAKAAKLSRLLAAYSRRLNRERFVVRVLSVTPDGEEDVFDVSVEKAHAFDANGFMAHNCGEQPLLPYESCNLGSINLTRFVKDGRLDFARLDETVDAAVHFLDNVIDANRYPMPEIERATLDSRKIGLGIMGFSDCLYMMNIPYDSEEAVRLAEELFRRIADRGRAASVRLGERRGSFPLFARSAWKAQGFSALRNATVTTIAPTGTIGLIAGCSSGIEPVFALRYWRTMAEGTTFFETHSEFVRRAEALGTDLEGLFSGCARDGSIRTCKELPEDLRRVFVVARDISPEWHVRMQAAFQKFSDNGVSKTINLPRSATVEDVRKAYLLAHRLKCKGITVYREGSKEAEVLRAGPPTSALDKIPRLNSESCDPRDSTVCRRCPG